MEIIFHAITAWPHWLRRPFRRFIAAQASPCHFNTISAAGAASFRRTGRLRDATSYYFVSRRLEAAAAPGIFHSTIAHHGGLAAISLRAHAPTAYISRDAVYVVAQIGRNFITTSSRLFLLR